MRQPLHESDELSVFFAIDEDTDEAFIDLESTEGGPDLNVSEDVVVAVGGEVADVEVYDAHSARARLGYWAELEQEGLQIMIRLGEWFESWELA